MSDEFTVRLICWDCRYERHRKSTEGLQKMEWPLHQYKGAYCARCNSDRWSLEIVRDEQGSALVTHAEGEKTELSRLKEQMDFLSGYKFGYTDEYIEMLLAQIELRDREIVALKEQINGN